jgi:hypothetical protein
MKKVTFVTLLVTFLTSCASGQLTDVGQRLQEAERALCPLQTARNIDNTVDNLLALVPIISWQPVCVTQEAESGS